MTVAVACGSDVTAPGMWTQFPQPPSEWRIATVEKVGSMGARLYTLGLFKLATESALAGNQTERVRVIYIYIHTVRSTTGTSSVQHTNVHAHGHETIGT